nr:hypothetical protein [uncultured Oscillibacter sp.]
MCRFAPEISADKEENRRNPDGFQDFLTQSSGNLWREAVCGDFISGSLSAMYHDDPPMLKTLSPLEDPQSVEEQKIVTQLRAVDEKIAEALAPSIEALADKQAEQSFYKGVRFGAQLMAELMTH